jgi:hypothetical protein
MRVRGRVLGPSLDGQQDAFGHKQDWVNIAVDFLWPCRIVPSVVGSRTVTTWRVGRVAGAMSPRTC